MSEETNRLGGVANASGPRLTRLVEMEAVGRGAEAATEAELAEKEAIRASLPVALLKRYDLHLSKGRMPVVHPANGRCSACYIALSNRILYEIEREEAASICEYCGVILTSGHRRDLDHE